MKTKSSLKYKLLSLIVVVSLIPCLLIGFAAYTLTRSSLLESAISSTETLNSHKAEAFDLFASELEVILKDLSDSEATKAYLQLREEPDSESYYRCVARLSEKIDTLITQRGDAVSAVAFLWNDGSLPMVRSTGRPFSLLGDYRLFSPYKEMLQADAAVHWTVLQTRFSYQEDLFLYKTIYNVLSGKNLGVVLIRIDESYIKSILQTANGTNDRTMLFVQPDSPIFYAGTMDENEVNAEEIQNFAFTSTDSHKIVGSPEKYLLTKANSKEIGYTIVNVTQLADISNRSNQVMISVIISLVAVMVLAAVMALAFYRYLKVPIIDVHSAMTNFRKGNLDERIAVSRTDELGQLGVGFNEMADQINLLIETNQQELRKKQEISMRFLQAQINPHFLYNTLNAIKSLTRMKRNAEACDMITSLISLLRLASGGSEEITLSQELRYVESYVMLMSKRKDIHVDLVIVLPDELKNSKILKFTIQPFVENSIIHGMSDSSIQVQITAQGTEKGLEVHVRDNGVGFDSNLLPPKSRTNETQHFNHIGNQNVSDRIKLYYGDAFGVDIDSKIGCGTNVTIRLPLCKMQEAETGESICKI